MLDLLRTHKVPLYKRSKEEGYLNDNHEWVQSFFEEAIEYDCNIQPLSAGKKEIILPDGVRTDDVIIVRSNTPLVMSDQYGTEEGDEIEYKGIRYEIFKEEDWNGYGLHSDHYKYLMKRKDQL